MKKRTIGYEVRVRVSLSEKNYKTKPRIPQIEIYVDGKPMGEYTPSQLRKMGVEVESSYFRQSMFIIQAGALEKEIQKTLEESRKLKR